MVRWCSPSFSVVSGSGDEDRRVAPPPPGGPRVLHTAADGAVEASISNGEMRVRAWRQGKRTGWVEVIAP
ncbi:MAG: hypothetical protein K8T25_00470 [Planctomycetia bacterium]|nr:hypothetical protein [Planctomycetia bacterium]